MLARQGLRADERKRNARSPRKLASMQSSERGAARRFALALVAAVALHALLASILPGFPSLRTSRRAVPPARIHIMQVTRVQPTPVPTPSPAPIAQHASQAVQPIPQTLSGAQAARAQLHAAGGASVLPPPIATPVAPAPLPSSAGQSAGAGRKSGAGSLGAGGTGSGAASTGSGSGASAGVTPCGYVNIIALQRERVGGYVRVRVEISVRLSDGSAQIARLDYPFLYPNDIGDPFSPEHRNDPNYPVTFQTPPPELRATEPPLVQYVIAHSTPEGFTVLKPCP